MIRLSVLYQKTEGASLDHDYYRDSHVPLALNAQGKRLAKRYGAVTLGELGVPRAWDLITGSLDWPAADMAEVLARFDPAGLPRAPWIYSGA